MAFASVAALISGEAASATLVLGAMTEIGTAMTIVGAATGSKSLMKIGGVMGLVGGVGGMVNGAIGGAASATDAASGGLNAAADSQAANVAIDQAGGDALGGYTGTGGVSGIDSATAGQGVGELSADTGATTGMQDTSNIDFGSMVDDAQQSLGSDVKDITNDRALSSPDQLAQNSGGIVQSVQGTPPATPSATPVTTPATQDAFNAAKDSQQAYSSGSAYQNVMNTGATNSKSFFSNIMDWAKSNPQMTNGIMTLGGGLLKGMGERSMFDQKLAQQAKETQLRYGYGNQVAAFHPQSIVQSVRGAT